MKLPPKKYLKKTDIGDPLFYHYIPLIGWVFKKRLEVTLENLGGGFNNLLEIGFGSGLLFPELASRSKNLFGIDIHDSVPLVEDMAKKLEIKAELKKGSVLELPYADNFFDAVVAVSIFEHIPPRELDRAFSEVRRVLAPGGRAVISFPVRNIITDVFFQTLGWNSKEWNPRVMHPSGQKDIIEAAGRYLSVKKTSIFPSFLPLSLSLYCSIACLKE